MGIKIKTRNKKKKSKKRWNIFFISGLFTGKLTIFAKIDIKFLSKTQIGFNYLLQYLQYIYLIDHIKNPEIRKDFFRIVDKKFIYAPNVFAITALITAYTKCSGYADLLQQYLDENFQYIKEFISEIDPPIGVVRREGTPVVWLDFRNAGIPHDKIFQFLLDKANLITIDGAIFGEVGSGFQRISLGLPRILIEKAMSNLKQAMDTLK